MTVDDDSRVLSVSASNTSWPPRAAGRRFQLRYQKIIPSPGKKREIFSSETAHSSAGDDRKSICRSNYCDHHWAHTNLAIFLMSHPHLKKNINHIYVMGGGVRSKNPTGCCPAGPSPSCVPVQWEFGESFH
ncbi:hypothetical protein SAY87_023626 [Trapa incisa]|uniref:Uncharacterized protein n=1 Tax=Trapa incisa TaxID=236973 RepID=A0AAN7KZ47_9MYRT|nr:hypothetical protein SAY87_023626 [Trapa incisa]